MSVSCLTFQILVNTTHLCKCSPSYSFNGVKANVFVSHTGVDQMQSTNCHYDTSEILNTPQTHSSSHATLVVLEQRDKPTKWNQLFFSLKCHMTLLQTRGSKSSTATVDVTGHFLFLQHSSCHPQFALKLIYA